MARTHNTARTYHYEGPVIYRPEQVYGSIPVTMEERILWAVSHHTMISEEDMRSESRRSCDVTARQIAQALMFSMTPLNLTEIGRRFDRDHTTVIYARKAVTDHLDTEDGFVNLMFEIYQSIIDQ